MLQLYTITFYAPLSAFRVTVAVTLKRHWLSVIRLSRYRMVQIQYPCAFSYVTWGRQLVRISAGTPNTGSDVHWNVFVDGAGSSWFDGMFVHISHMNMVADQCAEKSAPSVQCCLNNGHRIHRIRTALCLQIRQKTTVGISAG